MKKQNMVLTYACKDTDIIGSFPPVQYNGVQIRDDAICEVMDTTTFEIRGMYKMRDGLWHEYIVGESAWGDAVYQVWSDIPDSPVLTRVFPYQIITNVGGTLIRLFCAKQPIKFFYNSGVSFLDTSPIREELCKVFTAGDGIWYNEQDIDINLSLPDHVVYLANHDILDENTGNLWFATIT